MSMNLCLQVFEDSTQETMIADWSSRAVGVSFETNERGFSFLQAFIPMSISETFRYYNDVPFAHAVLGDGGFHAFEGRIEDREIVDGGLRIGAYGYQRALHDVLYTSLWATVDYSKWRTATEEMITGHNPAKFTFDTNERLYIALKKNERYAQAGNYGALIFQAPHLDENGVKEIEYTVDVDLPAGFVGQLISYDWDLTNPVTESSPLSNGAATTTITSGKEAVSFRVVNATAADPYTNTAESSRYYLQVTDIRVKGTVSNNVYGDEIVKDIVSYVNGINSTQLDSSTGLVDNPNVDLPEILLEDVIPADFLSDLANLGDDSSPPDTWEWGVWEGLKLHFREKGSKGLDWYTDVQSLRVNSALDTLENYVYATYKDRGGVTKRTAAGEDAESQARYGVTRHGFVNVGSNDGTHPTTIRDARLEDAKDVAPRGEITIPIVFNEAGAMVPPYVVRAGDTMTIRNMPVTGFPGVDRIRKFRISRTSFDGMLKVTPEFSPPSLLDLVAINTAFDNPRRLGRLRNR